MNMTIQPATPAERLYTYTQSQQIIGQTGCIGHLRADIDTDGIAIYSQWNGHNEKLKTDAFKAEFDIVLDMLRFDERYGSVLKNRMNLAAYCYSHPDSSFGKFTDEFGFRADTKQYAYLMRLNPNPGEYNLFVYCYQREWLDRHLKQAEKGIRFIDPNYKELFRIPDGDQIRIIREDGTHTDKVCRYIDDYHVEIGGGWDSMFHICQFAEQMERCGNAVIPLRSSLPAQCYVFLPTTQEIGIVKKGESGYYRSDLSPVYGQDGKAFVEELNRQGGVTKAQAAAMSAGSMFGWACPAADPKSYDKNGQLLKPKQRERGEAR